MKSLLVPVNYTKNAANAARYSADLAMAIQADVHLLHVMDLAYAFEETEKKGRDLLKSLQEEMTGRVRGQIKVTTSLQMGGVATGIEEYCRRLNPFAVVMGADDADFHGGFAEEHILRAVKHLRKPLLVIPAGATFHAIRKVVLACERTDIASELPVSPEFLQQLRSYFACTFDIISVSGKKEKGLSESFDRTLQGFYPELHFIQSEGIEEGIRDYLKTNAVDWLMVFPKKHWLLEFHRSRAIRIVSNCPIPVLSIRA